MCWFHRSWQQARPKAHFLISYAGSSIAIQKRATILATVPVLMSSPSIPVRMSYTPIHAHHTRSIGSDSQGANSIAILNARVNDLWEFVGNYLSIQKRTSISLSVGLVILVDIPTSTTLRAGNMPQLWQMTWLGQRIHCSGL